MREIEKQMLDRSAPDAVVSIFREKMKALEAVLAQGVKDSITNEALVPDQVITDRTFAASKRTMDRLSGNISDTLAEIYKLGLNERDAKEMLRKNVKDAADYELERIARTEIHVAQETANFEAKKISGTSYQEWITAEDERVRSLHVPLDGEIVAVGDPFSNGLLYPGDPSGPADQVINCRCAAVTFVMPRSKIAPAGLSPFRKSDLVEVK